MHHAIPLVFILTNERLLIGYIPILYKFPPQFRELIVFEDVFVHFFELFKVLRFDFCHL